MGLSKKLLIRFGPERFLNRPENLEPYSKDLSLAPPKKPDCVVKVKSAEEVQFVLRMAQTYSVPVTPSSSKVHFHGLTLPEKGGILLDLSEMNRILEIDPLNRRVRIEAGVTWDELLKALKDKGLRVMMPLFPHPLRSVVTDVLEREPITNTVYEYGEPLQGMEVVWPNGEIFRTGSASVAGYPDSIAKGVNPAGPGIDFYRLLQGAQGTFGVVTWANLKVEFLPKVDKLFFIPLSHLSRGMGFLSKILRLRVGQESFLLNRKHLSLLFNLDAACLEEEFFLFLVLSGFHRYPEMKIGYEEDLLRRTVRREFQEFRLHDEIPYGPPSTEFVKMLRNPWPDPQTYWKHRWKGGCQNLFFITKPFMVERFIDLIGRLAERFGYAREEMGIYIQPIEHNRACHLEFDFFYDRESAVEKERVLQILREGVRHCLVEGALFTRPYGEASNLVFERTPEYAKVLNRMKGLFDPLHLMNPGRLCF